MPHSVAPHEEPITTNDLKKGDKVLLRNGWKATIEDNLKGNTRMCTVYGDVTEMGSVYSHDMIYLFKGGRSIRMDSVANMCAKVAISHTPAQIKLRDTTKALGF